MDRESVLKTLLLDDFKHLTNKELCKLFKFLSCFFCCLDHSECDDDHKDEYPCYCPYFPCKPKEK